MELEKLIAKLEADISDFRSNMQQAVNIGKKTSSTLGGAFKGIGGALKGVTSAAFSLKGALVGIGVGAVAKSFIDAANTSEQFHVRLNTLLGSVSEGNRLFDDMTKFASKVPFEYENIMNAATRMGSVVKGGVDDINKYMPMVADLAAAYGLSIEQTADQFSKAMSAGAGAADIFRDRGINDMLGFKQGAQVTGAEFTKAFEDAFNSTNSKFRGATAGLANTWQGTMSMLSDKWFQFRNSIMEAGVFDFLKGLAQTLDDRLGKALDGSKDSAKGWATIVIDGIKNVMLFFAKLVDFMSILKMVWKGLELAFAGLKAVIYKGLEFIAKAIVPAKNAFKGFELVWLTLKKVFLGWQALILQGVSVIFDEVGKVYKFFGKEPPSVAQGIKKWRDEAIKSIGDVDAEFMKVLNDQAKGNPELEAVFKNLSAEAVQDISKLKEELSTMTVDPSALQAVTQFIADAEARAAAMAAKRESDSKKGPAKTSGFGAAGGPDKEDKAADDKLAKQYDTLKESLDSEVNLEGDTWARKLELEQQAYEDKQMLAEEAFQNLIINEAEKNATLEKLEAQHKKKMADIERQAFNMKLSAARQGFGALMTLTAGRSKALFQVAKAGAIATAIVDAHAAFNSALKGPPGPPWSYGIAAAALASGLSNVASIRSTNFGGGGGGGGGGSAGGGGGAVASPTPVAAPSIQPTAAPAAAAALSINLGDEDDVVSKRTIRSIMEKINEQIQDGVALTGIVVT